MARPEGFEPPTPRFVVWCSIQLSYGRLERRDIGRWAGIGNSLAGQTFEQRAIHRGKIKRSRLFGGEPPPALPLECLGLAVPHPASVKQQDKPRTTVDRSF